MSVPWTARSCLPWPKGGPHGSRSQLTGANRNDSQQALTLVDAIPSLQGERGRPRHRPESVLGDRGYDSEPIRQGLRARHIVPLLAMRNTAHGSGLGRWRWVVDALSHGSFNSGEYEFDMKGAPTYTRHF